MVHDRSTVLRTFSRATTSPRRSPPGSGGGDADGGRSSRDTTATRRRKFPGSGGPCVGRSSRGGRSGGEAAGGSEQRVRGRRGARAHRSRATAARFSMWWSVCGAAGSVCCHQPVASVRAFARSVLGVFHFCFFFSNFHLRARACPSSHGPAFFFSRTDIFARRRRVFGARLVFAAVVECFAHTSFVCSARRMYGARFVRVRVRVWCA